MLCSVAGTTTLDREWDIVTPKETKGTFSINFFFKVQNFKIFIKFQKLKKNLKFS
jgi:hypothetical protein